MRKAYQHRLMCGDSTNPQHVDALMAGAQAQLVFTSPPYGQQRDYGKKITDWGVLMRDVFTLLPAAEDVQILVNLGLVHQEGQWVPYWRAWLDAMRDMNWRQFGLYVWDQGPGMPGEWHGRLAPAFELVFHFNKKARSPNKTKQCVHAGEVVHSAGSAGVRLKDGSLDTWTHGGAKTQDKKIADSVIRATRHKGTCGGHPAPFSVAFATEVIEAYSSPQDVLYEPFTGSGTTMLAAHQLGRIVYGMELEPSYCDIALARWEKLTGKNAVLLGSSEGAP